jgi:hypothetical protein
VGFPLTPHAASAKKKDKKMLVGEREHIKSLVKSGGDGWLERMSSREIETLMKIHSDVTQETITVEERPGVGKLKKVYPEKYFDRFILYKFLRSKRRIPKDKRAEQQIREIQKIRKEI